MATSPSRAADSSCVAACSYQSTLYTHCMKLTHKIQLHLCHIRSVFLFIEDVNCYIIMVIVAKIKLHSSCLPNWVLGKPAAFDLSVTSPKHCSNDAKCDELAWVCVPIHLMELGEWRLLESYLPASIPFSHLLLKVKVSDSYTELYGRLNLHPTLCELMPLPSFVIVIFILINDYLKLFDEEVRLCFTSCIAVDVPDPSRQQAQLRPSLDELGFRSLALHEKLSTKFIIFVVQTMLHFVVPTQNS